MLNIEYYQKEIRRILEDNFNSIEIDRCFKELGESLSGHRMMYREEMLDWLLEKHECIELTAEEVEWLANMLSRYSKSNITIERRYEESNDQYYLKIVIDKNISVFSIDKEEYQSLELFKEYTPSDLKLESFYEVEDEYL